MIHTDQQLPKPLRVIMVARKNHSALLAMAMSDNHPNEVLVTGDSLFDTAAKLSIDQRAN